MDKTTNQIDNSQIKSKKLVVFTMVVITLGALLALAFLNIATDDRQLPKKLSSREESAIRGSIVSKDGFNICVSKKLYKATIDTRCLNKDKKEEGGLIPNQ